MNTTFITSSGLRHLKGFVLLAVGIGLFVVVLLQTGVDNWTSLLRLVPTPTALAIFFTATSTGVLALRWRSISTILNPDTPTLFAYYKCLSAILLLGQILPKELADLGGRTYWLKKNSNHTYYTSAMTIFWDRMFDLIVLPFTIPAGIVYLVTKGNTEISLLFLAGGILCGWLFTMWQGKQLLIWMLKFPNYLGNRFHRLHFLSDSTPNDIPEELVTRKRLGWFFSLTALKTILLALTYAAFSEALGLKIPLWILILCTPISQLAFAFSFTAGGLGVLDAGWMGILTLAEAPENSIGLFLVGQRLLTIACMFIVYIGALVFSLFSKTTSPPVLPTDKFVQR